MKDVNLIEAVRYAATIYNEGGPMHTQLTLAADRLEELTKQPEDKPHPQQQQWNIGRKNPEDYND